MKICRVCKINKLVHDFVQNKLSPNGRDSICLVCNRQRVKEWRKGKPRGKRKNISMGWRDIIADFLVKRDGLICGICKKSLEGSKFHIDHILPVALGGQDIMENVQLAHPECNIGQSLTIRKQSHGF